MPHMLIKYAHMLIKYAHMLICISAGEGSRHFSAFHSLFKEIFISSILLASSNSMTMSSHITVNALSYRKEGNYSTAKYPVKEYTKIAIIIIVNLLKNSTSFHV